MAPVTGFEGFEDDSESPYYRSEKRPLSPAQTWLAIHARMVEVVIRLRESTRHRPVRIDLDRIVAWHRQVFAPDFDSGGALRTGDTWFGFREPSGPRMIRPGSSPERLRADLRAACAEHESRRAATTTTEGTIRLRDSCETAARIYARVLAIHPFDDGNGRVGYIALQASLLSQGLSWINFVDAREEHDQCLGAALVVDREPDYAPLAGLLAERVIEAIGPGGTIPS